MHGDAFIADDLGASQLKIWTMQPMRRSLELSENDHRTMSVLLRGEPDYEQEPRVR